MDRRLFLQASGAAALASGAGGASSEAPADASLRALLQQGAEQLLIQWPQDATRMEFDVGAHRGLRARLDDRSAAGLAALKLSADVMRAALSRIEPGALSPSAARDREAALFVYATLSDLLGRYGYIDLNLRPSPYVVSQMNGAYYWLPDTLGGQPLATRADVEAWEGRLSALAVALDQESDRIGSDAARGVVPPSFVIDATLPQIARLRDAPPSASGMIAPAIARAARAGLGDISRRGERLFRDVVRPALTRQMTALEALRPTAADTAGVWRLPEGEAYYAAALRANTTLDLAPDDLHIAGQTQLDALLSEIDVSLQAQGLSLGSVGARLSALNQDPRFRVADDDAGRARLIGLAKGELADVIQRLPQAFHAPIVDPLAVRRMSVGVEAGSPGAFYQEGANGEVGAIVLNLQHPADLATWRLPTLLHHEGVPGHHFQFGVMRRAGALPLFSRLLQFSAYTEGWALYAEQVADEIGCYEHDPFGRIGYLQSELFRTARIVVDTGLHQKRWTRDQAVEFMVSRIGETPNETRREINRYCVYPGQACSFKAGANTIVAARESARRRLGARFNIQDFHDRVLSSGPMPMTVLERTIAQWTV